MIPFPYLPFQHNFSPAQGINQAQQGRLYHSSGPYRSPTEMASPFPAHQGTPGVWNGPNGTPRHGTPPNSSRGSNIPNTGFRPVGSPSFSSGRGRAHWHSNSQSPVSGRGCSSTPNSGRSKNGWFGSSTSPSSGRGRVRGRGHVSAQYRPELFYKKSMVGDPWKFLKPVIWSREEDSGKTENDVDSPKSWFPKSIYKHERPRVSEATNESSSQQSLAEYLAASFNEAVNDTSG